MICDIHFYSLHPDFTSPAYREHSLFEEAVKRYLPLKGETVISTIRETKKIIEIIAILGGQWPHSSFMVPGGVVSVPGQNDITQCRSLLANFRHWYEGRILGCQLARWSEIKTLEDLDLWLQEKPAHRESELGFFIRFSREAKLHKLGQRHPNFISFGSFEIPISTELKAPFDGSYLFQPGFLMNGVMHPFDQEKITEDVTFSHFQSHGNPLHPFEETTVIETPHADHKAYSWGKAPRYDGYPAETGPLAELAMASHPLIQRFLNKDGPNVFYSPAGPSDQAHVPVARHGLLAQGNRSEK